MCAAPARIRTASDFQYIKKHGKRLSTPGFLLQIVKTSPVAPFRFGLIASRKTGNAVRRNRIKRRLRDVVRQGASGLSGMDAVLIARTAAADMSFDKMCHDLNTGLKKLESTV